MDVLTRFLTASTELLMVVGIVVVLMVAVYLFAKSIAEGQGAVVGFKKMWAVLWKNMP